MSRRTELAIACFVLAGLSLLVFFAVGGHTMHSYASTGSVPTSTGWNWLAGSLISTGGFTVSGAFTLLLHWFIPTASPVTDGNVAEITELAASFAGLMKDRTNRAAQRRFFFALVDASQIMPGVVATHVNGVVSLQYSGFADPVPTGPTK